MTSREQARELLMKMIFQMDAQNDFSEEAKDTYLSNYPVTGKSLDYFNDMYTVISGNIAQIDMIIEQASERWKVSRMAKVDLAICRLSIAEMMFNNDVPAPVSINEAVNLAKKYGTEDSRKFINGLLGKAVTITDDGE